MCDLRSEKSVYLLPLSRYKPWAADLGDFLALL